MMHNHLLDHVPMWVFFVFITLITLLPIEAGQRLGRRRRQHAEHEAEGPVGSVVGATLALLGFMVALTLGAATNRYDLRKEALRDGVNAIETAYRNTSLLPEPHKSELRALLREWVAVRLDMDQYYNQPDGMRVLDNRVQSMKHALWSHAEALAAADRSSETYALATASLNEVFQVHNKRVILGAQDRIPLAVWAVLIFVTINTMLGVGFQFGLTGRRSMIANAMLACTFSLVMTLIFDIDQPGKGVVSVSQQPMHDLHERMQAQR